MVTGEVSCTLCKLSGYILVDGHVVYGNIVEKFLLCEVQSSSSVVASENT